MPDRVGNGSGPFVELVRGCHRGISWGLLEATVKYVILLLNTEAARGMSEAEGQQWYAEIGAWYEKGGGGSGKLVETGYQLAPPNTPNGARPGTYSRLV